MAAFGTGLGEAMISQSRRTDKGRDYQAEQEAFHFFLPVWGLHVCHIEHCGTINTNRYGSEEANLMSFANINGRKANNFIFKARVVMGNE
jgi:hypothetical protein